MPIKPLPFLAGTALEQRLVVALAFVQGVLLYLLYRSVDAGQWPAGQPVPLYLLATLLIGVPWFLLMLLEPGRLRRALQLVPVYALVTALAAISFGSQALPADRVDNRNMLPAYVVTMLIATFKALIYAQQYVRNERITYGALLKNSWRLALLAGLSGLFVALLQLVLFLWGALFELIGVGIFSFVLRSAWFVIPCCTTAFGLALILFGNLDSIIDNLGRLLKTMLRFLLPMLAVIALLFVVFLPFTGLQHLWDAKLGSLTLLWLMALLLFFVNAVYQSSVDSQLRTNALPYSLGLHRLIAAAVAVLPVFGILSLHGLLTRIAQYGLTVERLWGLIVALLLLGFATGYLWSVAQRRDQWLTGLHQINIGMGLVVLAVTVATNTPLLNLQAWSAHSQLARLDRGLAPSEIDIRYFRRALGRAGYEALQSLKERYAGSDATFVASIDQLFAPVAAAPQTLAQLRERLVTWPAGRQVPDAVLQPLLTQIQPFGSNFHEAYALFSDLDGDGQDEIVVLSWQLNNYSSGSLWTQREGAWVRNPYRVNAFPPPPAVKAAIDSGDIAIQQPHWQQLRIGTLLIQPQQSDANTR